MVTTLKDFILRVNELKFNSLVAPLFEDACSDELRELIYSLADPHSPEPFRSAMHNIGFVNY